MWHFTPTSIYVVLQSAPLPSGRRLSPSAMPKPGRPPLGEAAASTRIQLRVTPAQRLELRRIAQQNGTGTSGVLREAVTCYMAERIERQQAGVRKR